MEKLTINENIKLMASRAGLSISALARVMGDSPQNFAQKMKRDNFRITDLEKIANACGCRFEWEFKEKD